MEDIQTRQNNVTLEATVVAAEDALETPQLIERRPRYVDTTTGRYHKTIDASQTTQLDPLRRIISTTAMRMITTAWSRPIIITQ